MPSLGGARPLSTISLLNPAHHSQAQLPTQDGDEETSRTPSPTPFQPFTDESIVPTTLLAELEARKAKQKSRSRTAADVNTNGIRSTLLELDAVAEVAAHQRKTKRTALAWENNGEPEDEDDADDDVPLGVLYAGNAGKGNNGKEGAIIGGLIGKREMEDSEPLSKRRERLRAEKGLSAIRLPGGAGSAAANDDSESEEETLAQRKARLKSQLPKPDFGESSLSLDLSISQTNNTAPQDGPEEEETLAQRRARLKAEKEEKSRISQLQQSVRLHQLQSQSSRQSLAPTPQGGFLGQIAAQQPRGSYYAGPGKGLVSTSASNLDLAQQYNNQQQRQSMFYPPLPQGHQQNMMQQQQYQQQQQQYYHPAAVASGYAQPGVPLALQQLALQQGFQPLDQRQRDMVERWRESVM